MKRASGIVGPEADADLVAAAPRVAPRVATVRGCGNCEWFHRHDAAMGYCHRYPPAALPVEVRRMPSGVQDVTTVGAWAPVVPTDMCGEWTRKAMAAAGDDFAALERTEGQA
jgi:hypothetical protein